MDSRQFHELLDACRPGSDDLAQPEMSELRAALEAEPAKRRHAERVEQFDRAVAASLHDVPLPEGLKDRLLAKLAEDAAPLETPPVEEIESAPAAGSRRRRLLLATAGTLAALAASALLAVFGWGGGESWAPAPIAEIAAQSLDDYDPSRREGWIAGKAPSSRYPLSPAIVPDRQPWQRAVRGVAGCAGMAYRLQSRQRVLGVLFVLDPRYTLQDFPKRPPKNPQVNTAGRIAVCWAEGDRLYVLVYEGAAKDYRGFLRQSGPVALLTDQAQTF